MDRIKELIEAKHLLSRWLYAPANCGPEGMQKLATDTGGFLNRHKRWNRRAGNKKGGKEARP